MRDAVNIQAVEQLGIDWMGMIFWPKSSRYVADVPTYRSSMQAWRISVSMSVTISSILSNCMDMKRLPLPKP